MDARALTATPGPPGSAGPASPPRGHCHGAPARGFGQPGPCRPAVRPVWRPARRSPLPAPKRRQPAPASRFRPARTSSGTPAMAVAITGRPAAIASITTIGRPSAKLGRISACAAARCARTCASSCQPVRVTRPASPACRNRRLQRRRAADRRRPASGAGRGGAERPAASASISRGKPFCSTSRPIATRCGPPVGNGAGSGHSARLDAAMHHLQPRPVGRIGPAAQLAAAIGTDRHHEGRAVRSFRASDSATRRVELFRPMDGEAEARPAQRVGQHRHRGRIGAEMRVQMGDRQARRSVAADRPPRPDRSGAAAARPPRACRSAQASRSAQRHPPGRRQRRAQGSQRQSACRPPSAHVRSRASSARSSASTSDARSLRMAKRWTCQPSRSSARISRRMKVCEARG